MLQTSLVDSDNRTFPLIADYLEYTGKFSESPDDFHLFTLLFTVAATVNRTRWLVQGEDDIYPNLYVLCVAPSSLYKKSSTIGISKKMLLRLQAMDPKGFIGHIGSPEGLFQALIDNSGSAVAFYSELGVLLAQASSRKYMSDVLDMLTDLYDSPDYYPRRLRDSLYQARNVCMNFISASQLDSLTKYVKESDLLSGFLPRFATVYSDNLKPHLVRRPEPDIQLRNRILSALNEIRKTCQESPNRMELETAAWDYFESWAHERYQEATVAPPQIQPLYGRLEAHALKFAIIIHLTRDPASLDIDRTSIEAACDCADFVLSSYRRLVLSELTFNENDRKLKRISDTIRNAGTISRRDLMAATRYRTRELEEYLHMLKIMGKVNFESGQKGGQVYVWIEKC